MISKEQIESLGFTFQSQELDGNVIIDYYLYEDDSYKLEVEQHKNKSTANGCLYSYSKFGIEVKFEGIIRDMYDLQIVKELCIIM